MIQFNIGGPALSSQGALIVHSPSASDGSYLFAVNPSSNSVSMFSFNNIDPTSVTLVNTGMVLAYDHHFTRCSP